jgi:uncharacterized membrane protein YhdT
MRLPTPLRRLLAAIPDLGLAVLFVAVWIAPARFTPALPGQLALLMLFEFVLMHAGFVLLTLADFRTGRAGLGTGAGAYRQRRLSLVVVAAFVAYLAFAALIARAAQDAWPFLALVATFVAKAGGLLLQAPAQDLERDRVVAVSLGCVAIYLVGFFATALVPGVPALGLADLPVDPGFTGLPVWQEAPWRLCAWGAIHFAACAAVRALAVQREV